jgi:hypothetical protein
MSSSSLTCIQRGSQRAVNGRNGARDGRGLHQSPCQLSQQSSSPLLTSHRGCVMHTQWGFQDAVDGRNEPWMDELISSLHPMRLPRRCGWEKWCHLGSWEMLHLSSRLVLPALWLQRRCEWEKWNHGWMRSLSVVFMQRGFQVAVDGRNGKFDFGILNSLGHSRDTMTTSNIATSVLGSRHRSCPTSVSLKCRLQS